MTLLRKAAERFSRETGTPLTVVGTGLGGDASRDADPCVCGHIRLDHQDMNVGHEKLDRCWGGEQGCACREFREASA